MTRSVGRPALIAFGTIALLVLAARWQPVDAATKTWTGAGATENWSLGANWSGGTVPVAADTVVFDATSVKNVTIDVNVSVALLTVNAGYTGTLTQAAGRTITVGAGGWSQADGSFVGGDSAITLNGPFSLSGGSFMSPSGTLTITGNLTHSAGVLTATAGTIRLATSTATIDVPGTEPLFNLTIASGTKTISAGDVLSVAGALVLTDGLINTGTVEAQGSISQAVTFDGGTGTLLIDGSADQMLTGAASPTLGALPNVVINKPSGTLTLAGTIRTTRNWTYTAGTLAGGGSTLVFAGGTVTGSHTINAVDLRATTSIAAGTVLTVPGSLVFTAGALNGTGSVKAQGSISQASTSGAGTATLLVDGTADQTLTGSATATAGSLPNVVINKPSGTLTLAGTIRTTRNWTYTAGTLDTTGATLVFAGNQTVTGSMSLTNLTFNGSGATYTLTSGTTLTVAGALVLTDGAINTGTVEALGSISQAATFDGGTGTLLIDGTLDQTLTGAATATAGSLPNVVINKPSGTLTLAGTIRTTRNWTYTAGTLDTTGATLVFAGGTVSGSMAFPNLEIRATTSIAAGTTLTVTGSLILTSGSLNGLGTLEAQGSITQASTFGGGTATLLIDGAGDQTFTGFATVTAGGLPVVVIDKPSGTLTLAGMIRTTRNWTYAGGSVATAGSTVVFAGGTVTAAGMDLDDVMVSSGTVSLGSALDVTGDLQIVSGTLNTSLASHALTVLGGLIVDGTLRANASTLAVDGNVTINGAFIAGTSTLVLAGPGGQILGGAASPTLANLTIDDPGGVSLGTSITLTGTLTLTNGQFSIGPHVLGLSQPISGTPSNLSAGATSGIIVTGSGSGIVLPDSVGTLGDLTIANSNGASLSGMLTVEGTLRFTLGNLVATPFDVVLGPTATVVRTSGHVIGNLQKPVVAGAGVSLTFEIGDASAYAPLSVVFANVLAPGDLTASTTGGEHPNIVTSAIDPAQDVNRSWALSGSFAFDSFDVTLAFAASDVDPGADPLSFVIAEHDGAAWASLAVGSRTPTSVEALGSTAFGSFAVGEAAADLSVVQSALPNPVYVGQNLAYTIVVSNGGPADATLTALTDSVGPLGTIQSVATSQGTCAWTASTASCALATVPIGGSATVTIVVLTSGVGTLANDVAVSTSASDPDQSDNASTLLRSILSQPGPPSPAPTPTPTPTPSPPSPRAAIVLTDGIAPGVNRGTSGFTTRSLVVRRGAYITFLIRMDPALAGRTVEIWRRPKNGDWALVTKRLVASDGTVHYYARIRAWTGFWAKLDGAVSHGRIATAR